jgi:hypothetical protein
LPIKHAAGDSPAAKAPDFGINPAPRSMRGAWRFTWPAGSRHRRLLRLLIDKRLGEHRESGVGIPIFLKVASSSFAIRMPELLGPSPGRAATRHLSTAWACGEKIGVQGGEPLYSAMVSCPSFMMPDYGWRGANTTLCHKSGDGTNWSPGPTAFDDFGDAAISSRPRAVSACRDSVQLTR